MPHEPLYGLALFDAVLFCEEVAEDILVEGFWSDVVLGYLVDELRGVVELFEVRPREPYDRLFPFALLDKNLSVAHVVLDRRRMDVCKRDFDDVACRWINCDNGFLRQNEPSFAEVPVLVYVAQNVVYRGFTFAKDGAKKIGNVFGKLPFLYHAQSLPRPFFSGKPCARIKGFRKSVLLPSRLF